MSFSIQNILELYGLSLWNVSKYPYMIVTARRIPVPEPIAPIKSAMMVIKPIHTPPQNAATGI